ncbi:putative Sin3 binding protein-domain-containing protein [Aspergillus pseudonomiae]|uniref:Putative Sin3 binding protein-domain-containing protein n=1 Tax=Aspergillus pseudonomiae TaxID=1506151 RepID=A0A5N7DBF5_9EURO|nr:putative Sin3 binding protein-domain-containing protein [Aspergillus pseudonomiae]KAB8260607.1 putative Sin3 binding protein-domain-containing protein [Aspergillus pseudonomiae]KAE8403108.1 putative Sin3 binding protein-domain-containing protein [Aspergillus pseudonomiae]
MAAQTTTSSIAMALAGKTASVDIPKPRSAFTSGGRDSSRSGHTMLPTPPNSISPTLPPQAFKGQDVRHPASPPFATSQVDSDIDLGDADADSQNQHHQGVGDLDSTGTITPSMLAKYHLPDIMLQHGPLAIRHVMGYLTTSVPGFSRIPPAKARRLVVAALEGRGSDEKSGGPANDVIFEKVGWGRWDARRRGEPSRDAQHQNLSPPSSFSNSFSQRGIQIPGKRGSLQPYGSSVTGDSAVFSFTEMDYAGHISEHEADKMSLDGNDQEYCSSSEAPEDEIQDEDWGEEDVTDEEDWAQIGAAALRARSLNGGGGFVHGLHPSPQLRGGGPASSSLAKSAPRKPPIQQLGFSLPDGMVGNTEERAAVEALLRLGSM